MAYITMKEIKKNNGMVTIKSSKTFSGCAEGKGIRSKERKKNNVVIIIDAEKVEEYAEIEKELHACVQKLNRRTKELGYYITPKEMIKSVMMKKFLNFTLEVPALNRRTFYVVQRGRAIIPVSVERTFFEVFKGIVQSMKSRFNFGKRESIARRILR